MVTEVMGYVALVDHHVSGFLRRPNHGKGGLSLGVACRGIQGELGANGISDTGFGGVGDYHLIALDGHAIHRRSNSVLDIVAAHRIAR